MQAIVYYFSLPFLYFISALPFPLLYGLSDVIYILVFHVLGYRKKIVWQNLRNSFPDKNEKELKAIRKKFYRYFCDLFLETFKTLTITPKTMLKHCAFSPDTLELFASYASERKNVIIVMGHFGNWEWAGNSFSMLCKQQLYVIYHPLSNRWFNSLIVRMRTRFGTKLIEMKNTFRDMVSKKGELNATAFIADQTPQPENAYWTHFLNQDTPVFKGTEKIAQKLNYPVVYVTVKKIRRGFYEVCAEKLVDVPAQTRENEISELHTRKLEQDILTNPEIWLWTHRRWKHKKSKV